MKELNLLPFRRKYVDMLKPLFSFGKPVVVTEFGFHTFRRAEKASAMGMGNADYITLFPHQLPLAGHFIRPRVRVIHERDERLQARGPIDQLRLLDSAGVDGALIMTFVSPINPYDDIPLYDLDRDNFSLVKSYANDKHGVTYPDMTWEPKESFKAVADYYAKEKHQPIEP